MATFEENLKTASVVEIAQGIATAQSQMSRVYSYEDIAKELTVMSGEAFASRQDERAKIYRELADKYTAFARKYRSEQHKEAHERQIQLFAELERKEQDKHAG